MLQKKDEITIHRGTPHDLSAMVRLLGELFGIEKDFTFDAESQRRGLELMLGQPKKHCVLVADVGEGVVGMCTLQLVVSTAMGEQAGLLEDLVVASGYRGHGVGGRLIAAMEAWAREQNISRIQLLADVHNTRALNFYSVHKWETTQLVCLRKRIRKERTP